MIWTTHSSTLVCCFCLSHLSKPNSHLTIQGQTEDSCDVAEGSKFKSVATTMMGNWRRRPEETRQHGQLTLPGTLMTDHVVSQRCPIIRHTTIDTGDNDLPEGLVDRSVQITLTQEGDTLLDRRRSCSLHYLHSHRRTDFPVT